MIQTLYSSAGHLFLARIDAASSSASNFPGSQLARKIRSQFFSNLSSDLPGFGAILLLLDTRSSFGFRNFSCYSVNSIHHGEVFAKTIWTRTGRHNNDSRVAQRDFL